MPRSLVYLIYNLLLPLVLLFGIPGYIVKGLKRGNLRRNFKQRFGNLPDEITQLEDKPLWIHAVSVGEVLVASKIIRAILRQSPEEKIVLTTTTTTGYQVAEKELSGKAIVIHNPVDLPSVVRKVVKQINPRKMILVESEVWPNLIRHLGKLEVPVLLANARLSPRSEKRYLKAKNLIAPVFNQIERTSVPFIADVDRWAALGMDKASITVLGSVKFDESVAQRPDEKIDELANWLQENGCDKDRRVFLAGSTHAGEEAMCGRVWKRLRVKHPDLALVIVPRHAERAPDFKPDLEAFGLLPIYRSYQAPKTETVPCTVPDRTGYSDAIYISDTTGEQRAWFHLADVVFMGKSITGKGGQNPVEPILAGLPVIVGPHMQNFSEVVNDLVAKEGITQVEDEAGLTKAADQFLSSPELGQEQAATGKLALETHHGAAIRTAHWILSEA